MNDTAFYIVYVYICYIYSRWQHKSHALVNRDMRRLRYSLKKALFSFIYIKITTDTIQNCMSEKDRWWKIKIDFSKRQNIYYYVIKNIL